MTRFLPLGVAVFAAFAATPGLGEPEGSHFLDDSAVVLRVEDRAVRAGDFVTTYFNSWPEYRPMPDSAGRVQFLKQLETKEIMAIVAARGNRELGFEDRLTLRQHEERVLSNVLYQRMVDDSVRVTDADVEALKRQYSLEKRLRHIQFEDLATAKRVRADLLAKRITWKEAHRKYSKATQDPGPEGDLGWTQRNALSSQGFTQVFDLEPGQISPAFNDAVGPQLVQVVEQRPFSPPSWMVQEFRLRQESRKRQVDERTERINGRLRETLGLSFDEANIAWASSFFEPPPPPTDNSGAINISPAVKLPAFAPEDTARILIRWRDGRQFSLGNFMNAYRQTNAWFRARVHRPELLRAQAETYALDPYRAKMARDMGLQSDPRAQAMMGKKREEILVEHLYQDSIMNRVVVTPQQRRKYYDDHVGQFITWPKARFAAIRVVSRARADSVAAQLRAGVLAEDILQADSIRYGGSVGGIREINQSEEGRLFYKLLLEELKPGQVGIEPHDKGGFWVVQSLSYDSGRQLSYQESESYVEESLRNMAAEKLLEEFLARHRRKLRIEAHPELVMRIDLRDKTL
jgi:peptidyl-prolyl cis-trans isomerase C